jgi:hypothetical protein
MEEGRRDMTQGFEQQDRSAGLSFTKSAPSPQHGRKADPKVSKPTRPERTFEPRPGH